MAKGDALLLINSAVNLPLITVHYEGDSAREAVAPQVAGAQKLSQIQNLAAIISPSTSFSLRKCNWEYVNVQMCSSFDCVRENWRPLAARIQNRIPDASTYCDGRG